MVEGSTTVDTFIGDIGAEMKGDEFSFKFAYERRLLPHPYYNQVVTDLVVFRTRTEEEGIVIDVDTSVGSVLLGPPSSSNWFAFLDLDEPSLWLGGSTQFTYPLGPVELLAKVELAWWASPAFSGNTNSGRLRFFFVARKRRYSPSCYKTFCICPQHRASPRSAFDVVVDSQSFSFLFALVVVIRIFSRLEKGETVSSCSREFSPSACSRFSPFCHGTSSSATPCLAFLILLNTFILFRSGRAKKKIRYETHAGSAVSNGSLGKEAPSFVFYLLWQPAFTFCSLLNFAMTGRFIPTLSVRVFCISSSTAGFGK
ncbi:MAG: hypothetical protein GY822_28440 [Deltaproteobacteria bacterium]|nr:hypothetical protein [Deltaproteobacteria bacterium]